MEEIQITEKEVQDGFTYTYSAREQEEVKKIRAKYMRPEEDKMAQIRRLDRSVYKKGTKVSLVVGVIGALVMGTGMSLIMTELAGILGMTYMGSIIVGVVCGVVGMILVALAYPVYKKVLKSERDKIAPEILGLSEELLK